MTSPRRLPEIPPGALRDQGTDERVERVWQRLDGDLGTARPRPRSVLVWAPAALAIVFASGVFVGSRWFRAAPATAAQVAAEPTTVEGRAAGLTTPQAQPGKADGRNQSKEHRALTPPHASGEPEQAPPPSVGELPPAPTSALVPVEQPEWIVLSNSKDYAGAGAVIERQGGWDAVFAKATPSHKMTLVDLARATKKYDWAIKALREILEQSPNDPYAPIAAYTLGGMLQKSGDRAGAAKAFAAYRQMSPNGELAEDALASQFDVALGQGDTAQAKKLAEQYVKDYPTGRRIGDIRSKLVKLSPGAAPAKPEARPDSGGAAKVEDDTPYDEVDDDPPAKRK